MIPRTWVYLGDPARAALGEVTLRPDIPGYDEVALDAWGAVEPLLAQDPTIVVLRPYVDDFEALAGAHPSWVRAPWLLVAAGELPWEALKELGPFRQVSQDVRAYYEEAAMALANHVPGAHQAEAWYFSRTITGSNMRAVQAAMRDNGADRNDWFFLIPRSFGVG